MPTLGLGFGLKVLRMSEIPRAPYVAKAWSSSEDSKLLEMRSAGKSLYLIAKTLGRTLASVDSRISTIRKRTPDQIKNRKHPAMSRVMEARKPSEAQPAS